ncbi:hypothetical protein CFC21_095506 [Triticum aestivum]|uniref:Uncharacterized protein n=3 Tax=Triticum TaxID=4564 RepID=A0A3B6R883_WHEAT|nr:hypothetical protein TRIUR3_25268 [Triticum urartu]KAF7093073.1 hypothetical protein CFC21_095506 [Triticum aestivum]
MSTSRKQCSIAVLLLLVLVQLIGALARPPYIELQNHVSLCSYIVTRAIIFVQEPVTITNHEVKLENCVDAASLGYIALLDYSVSL